MRRLIPTPLRSGWPFPAVWAPQSGLQPASRAPWPFLLYDFESPSAPKRRLVERILDQHVAKPGDVRTDFFLRWSSVAADSYGMLALCQAGAKHFKGTRRSQHSWEVGHPVLQLSEDKPNAQCG